LKEQGFLHQQQLAVALSTPYGELLWQVMYAKPETTERLFANTCHQRKEHVNNNSNISIMKHSNHNKTIHTIQAITLIDINLGQWMSTIGKHTNSNNNSSNSNKKYQRHWVDTVYCDDATPTLDN
jgi:hypothetical protein